MARYRHPVTVGLAIDQWPEIDRTAWNHANSAGDLLRGRGAAAHWSEKMRRTASKAYGNWLRYLRDRGQLAPVASIGQRLNETALRGYIAALRIRVNIRTAHTQLNHLSAAIRAMDPNADRALIKRGLRNLSTLAKSAETVTPIHVTTTSLLKLGLDLMAHWTDRKDHDPRLNAMDYRDGLMIAFLALNPIRLANVAQMTIGHHLIVSKTSMRIAFAVTEMKGHRPLDAEFPARLEPHLRLYLGSIRSRLHKGPLPPPIANAMWPSLQGRPMSEHGIYTRITEITKRAFGHAVTPHMFRKCAATFIAETAPEMALLAASVLQHSNPTTTWQHYIHGQQHLASRRYHVAIDELIASIMEEPLLASD